LYDINANINLLLGPSFGSINNQIGVKWQNFPNCNVGVEGKMISSSSASIINFDYLLINDINTNSNINFNIFDVNGRLLYSGNQVGNLIDLAGKISNTGIYFARIRNEDGDFSVKFVKNN